MMNGRLPIHYREKDETVWAFCFLNMGDGFVGGHCLCSGNSGACEEEGSVPIILCREF